MQKRETEDEREREDGFINTKIPRSLLELWTCAISLLGSTLDITLFEKTIARGHSLLQETGKSFF